MNTNRMKINRRYAGLAGLLLCILALAALGSCKVKKMTLQQLAKAEWKPLDSGIGYISMREGTMNNPDSVRYNIIGAIDEDDSIYSLKNTTINDYHEVFNLFYNHLLTGKLSHSKSGYLRLDFSNLMSGNGIARIFLTDSYDTTRLQEELQALRTIPGITDAAYISKDSARKIYLAAGNEDWDKLLTENPLPASIDIYFDRERLGPEQYPGTESAIRKYVNGIHSIEFPAPLLKTKYFIEYERE